jgi:hypothetical protein
MIEKIKFHIRNTQFKSNKAIKLCVSIVKRYVRNKMGLDILHPSQFNSIPIIINNFNRLTYLKLLIQKLEEHNLHNIIILDNNSSYPPLLEYYKICKYPVHYFNENLGFLALWKSNLYDEIYSKSYYVLTDPDVIPDPDCPKDFIAHFYNLLQKHPELDKIGFSLRIDNIPDHYDRKQQVFEIENLFWKKKIGNDYFKAVIDTTFALYRPGVKGGFWINAGRTLPPYSALHLPWYENSEHPDEETLYYRNQAVYSKNWS